MKRELCLQRSGPRPFTPEDSEGHAIPPEDVPLMITITKKRPAYQRFFIPRSGRSQTCRGRVNSDFRARWRLLGRGGPIWEVSD
jgi:hypothetical protein